MPDLRTIIGETPVPDTDYSLDDLLSWNYDEDKLDLDKTLQDVSGGFADRMIAAIADRVAAALVSDEAVEAAARTLCPGDYDPDSTAGGSWDGGNIPPGKPAWTWWADDARAALQAAAKTIRK